MAKNTPTELPADLGVNDPLSMNVGRAGVWGMPGQPEGGAMDHPAELPREPFDYSAGIMVDPGAEADAAAPPLHPHLLRATTDVPHSFEIAHEATHRRFEPLRIVSVAQLTAGFTVLANPNQGLHYVKLIACNLTLDAAGTIKFVAGSADGTNVADLTGAMAMGGAAVPPLNLPPAPLENPWLFGGSDQALGIFTVTGKAAGWVTFCYSPYDA